MGFITPTKASAARWPRPAPTGRRRPAHQIGYVAHDLPLLAGSLRNLTLGARHISDSRMLEVAELTGVTDLARQHPQGFDRPVGERPTALRRPAPGRVAGPGRCWNRRS
jgi:ABC-type protease/lipase transport system fused ATPase/permease subunit